MEGKECPVCLQHTLHKNKHNRLWCENCGMIEKCRFCDEGVVCISAAGEVREINCIHCGGVGYIHRGGQKKKKRETP